MNWIWIICKEVLEAIYVFKVGFEAFEIEVYVWNKCICQASWYIEVLNEFLEIWFLLGKQRNASSRPWYSISRSWVVLHEPSSVKLDSAQKFWFAHGLISRPWYHASRSWPWSRATITIVTVVRQILECSRPLLTIVTTPFQLVTKWKIFDFQLVSFWFLLAFRGAIN